MKTIKINIKTIEQQKFKHYLNFIENILKKSNIFFKKINLPQKTKRIVLLKSPHVNKKAMEHFQLKTNRSTIIIKIQSKSLNFLYKLLILNKPKTIKVNLINIG